MSQHHMALRNKVAKGATDLSFLAHTVFNMIPKPKFPVLPITRQQILNSSKLKQFADDNFKFDNNSRKFSKRVENTVLIMSNFSFSHSVFKRLASQGHQKVLLCGNGLIRSIIQNRMYCNCVPFARK